MRTWLAVVATFVGSLLLFSLEPYVGKLLLPAFGGTPLLWNSCMVFFQVALLVGYGLAMLLVRHLSVSRQMSVQVLLLCTLFIVYPRAGESIELAATSPGIGLVIWLTRHVLLTFVALAALTTLVQSWLAHGTSPAVSSPYRLYAASNAGSMVGLFVYPLVFEPRLSLSGQRAVFLGLLAVVIAAIAALALTRRTTDGDESPPDAAHDRTFAGPVAFAAAAWWRVIALAAIPASLLLSVTNYILTDVASLPLFWVVPLALYLITFIITFGGRSTTPYTRLERVWTLAVLFIVVALAAEANSPASVLIPAHLAVFFVASLICHRRVASLAPHPQFLPQYYLAMSIGGALGGMITLLVPPLVTDRMSEYPIALVLATTVLTATRPTITVWWHRGRDLAIPAALVLIAATLFYRYSTVDQLRWSPLLFAPAALYVLNANERGPAFARRLAGLLTASLFVPSAYGTILYGERSFFGRVRVSYDRVRDAHLLVHGSTVHGIQRVGEMRGCKPATYYHPTGPIGRYLTALAPSAAPRRIALVGLGSGALACYARTGEQWDLYELDPVVARVASDTTWFTYLARSKAARQPLILGDARLALERDRNARYDVMIIDAFSSDAIPIHLLTREAVEGYARHLRPGGVLLFHVSNRFFQLQPILAAVATATGLEARAAADLNISTADADELKYPSEWVLLAPAGQVPTLDAQWIPIVQRAARTWTDDYSNPLGAMRFMSAFAPATPPAP